MDTETKKKNPLRRMGLRKIAGRSGWSAYETYCRMKLIKQEKHVKFSTIVDKALWKKYRLEHAEAVLGRGEMPIYVPDLTEEEFYKSYYKSSKKKAIRKIQEGNVTLQILADFLEIELPEELKAVDVNVMDLLVTKHEDLKEGGIYLSLIAEEAKADKVVEKKPLCVIGEPGNEKYYEGKGVVFIPCKYLFSLYVDLAEIWRMHFDIDVIGITGTIGKTTTREMIATVVGYKKNVHTNIGNQNTSVQVPMLTYQLRDEHDVYIQECSGAVPGQVERSSRAIRPTIFVITNIGTGHLGNHGGSQDMLLYEKIAFDRHALPDAVGLINWDDPLLKRVHYEHQIFGYGIKDSTADFFGDHIVEKDGDISFDVVEKDGTRTPVVIHVTGIYNVYNALAAFAVGLKTGLSREDIVKALDSFHTDGTRQNIVSFSGRTLYLDCYSATQESMKSCLTAMETMTVSDGGRKYAVLADVPQLKGDSEDIHRAIGKMTSEVQSADEIWFYGPQMKFAYEEAQKRDVPCRHTEDFKTLCGWIKDADVKDIIAFKASHKMHLQHAVDENFGTDFYHNDVLTANIPTTIDDNLKLKLKSIEDYGCVILSGEEECNGELLPDEYNGLPVRLIAANAFSGQNIEKAVLPENLLGVSKGAFAECRKLKAVQFNEGLRRIGEEAFMDCTALEEIDLSRGCGTIADRAFAGCNALRKVILPAEPISISDTTFDSDFQGDIYCSEGSMAENWAKERGLNIMTEPEKKTMEKGDLRRLGIRKITGRSGWGAYETYCRILEISQMEGVNPKDVAKKTLWKGYREKHADAMLGRGEIPAVTPEYTEKEFYKTYYRLKKRKAIKEIRKGNLTLPILADFLEIELPEQLKDYEGDIIDKISTTVSGTKEGGIYFSLNNEEKKAPKVSQKKPLCVIGEPTNQKYYEGRDVLFIPCNYLYSLYVDLAEIWRLRFDIDVIGITGTIGKTTTTEMVCCVVSAYKNLHRVYGNQNTSIQVPAITYRLKPEHEAFVQECSGAVPGQVERSSRALRPTVFVVTNIGTGHIGNHGGKQEMLMYEKIGFDRNMAPGGVGIVNWDDPMLKKVKFNHEVFGYGIEDPSADFFGDNIVERDGVIYFDVVEKDGTRTPAAINVCGVHNVYNALAAFAVGVKTGIPRDVIVKALLTFKTRGIRQNLVQLAGKRLYLDCYSATQESMRTCMTALNTMTVPEGGKKYAVLADIPHLYERSEEIHREVGKMTAEVGSADEVWFFGPEMKFAYEEAEKLGAGCRYTDEFKTLVGWMAAASEKDIIALKSSHRMHLQHAVDEIYGTDFYHKDELTVVIPDTYSEEDNIVFKCVDDYGSIVLRRRNTGNGINLPNEFGGLPVRLIAEAAFAGADFEEVVLPEHMMGLARKAFANCAKLKKVQFNPGLAMVGEEAFLNCTALEEADLSAGCGTIADKAFAGCVSLKKVSLPDGLITIADDAFDEGFDGVFSCKAGSPAEAWVKAHGMKLVTV